MKGMLDSCLLLRYNKINIVRADCAFAPNAEKEGKIMLYDHLENISQYKGLYKGLDAVIEWLQHNDLDQLPMGRTDILGDKVFVNKEEAELRDADQAQYECHKKYMDLQVDLEGSEGFKMCSGEFVWTKPYSDERDGGLGNGRDGCQGRLGNGMFVLFPADEPHMPNLVTEDKRVKKAVFKILRDELF